MRKSIFIGFVFIFISYFIQKYNKTIQHPAIQEAKPQMVRLNGSTETGKHNKKTQVKKVAIKKLNGVKDDSEKLLFEKIEKSINLTRKVLLTSSQKIEKQKLLSDVKLLSSILGWAKNTRFADSMGLNDNERQRMKGILLLVRSMEWEENPKFEQVTQLVTEYLLDSNLEKIADLSVRKSFAADKLELFTVLKTVDHEKGLLVERQNKSKIMAKLMRFANNYYQLN